MPSLKCPHCGTSDLHAVEVQKMDFPAFELKEAHELSCKQCGWTPSADSHPERVMSVTSMDDNQ